jgi:hypothetical protein
LAKITRDKRQRQAKVCDPIGLAG